MKKTSLAFFILCSMWGSPLFAQPDLAGSVKIEEFEVQETGQARGKKGALALFQNLATSLSAGQTPSSPKFDEHVAQFMSAVYLQCTSKRGVCPEILDAVLETDVIVSKLEGKTQCQNLKQLWASWVNLDMEKRLSLMTQIGMMAKIAQFNSVSRRKYIQCEATVEELLPKGSLFDRFGKSSEALARIELASQYIQEVAERSPNLFGALGIENANKEK